MGASLLQAPFIQAVPAAVVLIDIANLLSLAGLCYSLILQYNFARARSFASAAPWLEVRSQFTLVNTYLRLTRRYTANIPRSLTFGYPKPPVNPTRFDRMVGTMVPFPRKQNNPDETRSALCAITGVGVSRLGSFLDQNREVGDLGTQQLLAPLVTYTIVVGCLLVHGVVFFIALRRSASMLPSRIGFES